MAKYLTQEWLDLQTKLANETQPERPNVNVRLQYVVTGTPEGDVKHYWVLDKGRITDNAFGELPDAEVTLITKYEDAVRIQKGETNTNTAFMQGKVKVSGNKVKMLTLLPVTMSAEYKQFQEQLASETEF